MGEERRIVTVLFADVTGSTALGESMDPEDVRALLGRYYAIAKDVVASHGGSIEKFIGDAVVAVFGLPRAHGDDARRALSAALELSSRVRSDPGLGERIPIRIGVNTGEVVASRDQTVDDFLVTGDAVNVAARLQQATEPWAILCGERTAHAAGDAFTFGPWIAVEARGKRTPVKAAPLLDRASPSVSARTQLIGRADDLTQLELIAHRAFTDRRPFLVSLIAPAGTGKTRLLEEFLERLPRLAPKAAVAIAQCLPYGQRLTYWPLRAVLCRLVGVEEEAEPEAIREAVRTWLRAHGSEQPDRTADLLAATIGFGDSEIADRAALPAAWRTAVELASRRVPLVLVFEDLHWSSDSLLDLVEFVMQPRGEAAVMMIALTRPELLDRRPAWGGGRRNHVSLVLEPLRDAEIETLVQCLLPTPSSGVVARIVTRAEGNPFYAGELVRSLIDRVGAPVDGAAVDQALAMLPDTIQTTVLARLDLLPPGERRTLQLGAVFGRAFRSDGVVALAPELTSEIDRLIDMLLAKDLVRHAGMGSMVFRHILIREVAYQTLPRAERARLHGGAAAWLEARAGGREDALAELIAYHYREAASLISTHGGGPAAVGGVRQKAALWLARAADVAAAGAASVEAARHLRNAIEFAHPGDLPELYERLGHEELGWNSATAYLKALQLCREQHRPPDQELRVLASLITLHMRSQGSIANRPSDEEMARLLSEGDALLQASQDRRAVARFLIAKGFLAFWRLGDVTPHDLTESEASARGGLEIAEQLDDADLRSAALDALSGCAQQRGEWTRAREYARQRLALQDRLSLIERIDAYCVIAWSSSVLGDLDEAIETSAAGLALLQPGQVPAWALHLLAWRTYALTVRGLWDDALAAGDRAYQLWIETRRPAAGYALRGFVAALDVARARRNDQLIDRYQEVLAAILRDFTARTRWRRLDGFVSGDLDVVKTHMVGRFDFQHMSLEYLERGLSFAADRRQPPAADVVRPIAEFAAAHGYQVLEAQACRALGIALRDPAQLTHALDLFERIGAGPYAARTRCERAVLMDDEVSLDAGMRVLTELGDLNQLERIEQARG